MSAASASWIDDFPALLARFPPGVDIEALARESKAFRRPRGVRCGTDLMRLGLAWGPGGYSLQRVAAWAGERGIALLTEDALIQRLHATGPFLQTLVQRLLAPVDSAPSWHGRVLRVCDSTSLSEQASKGTDWRVHGVYDLGGGRFTHLEVTDRHGGEALDRGQPVAGEIRIADRGYANGQGWRRFVEAGAAQTDFIVRMRWNTVTLLDQADRCFDLIAWLQTRPRESEIHEIAAWAQTGKRQRPIGIRLIARRKSPEAIAAEHKRLRQRASRKQTQLDPRSLIAAEYLILATSFVNVGT